MIQEPNPNIDASFSNKSFTSVTWSTITCPISARAHITISLKIIIAFSIMHWFQILCIMPILPEIESRFLRWCYVTPLEVNPRSLFQISRLQACHSVRNISPATVILSVLTKNAQLFHVGFPVLRDRRLDSYVQYLVEMPGLHMADYLGLQGQKRP